MSRRAFVDEPLRPGTMVELNRDESHYLARVRRVAPGDTVELLDAQGPAHAATVIEADPRRVCVRVGEPRHDPAGPPLTLGIAIVDAKAGLDAIARAAEGGAARLVWVSATHSHGHTPSASRCERVLRASMRQCGRPRPMPIAGPTSLDGFLRAHPAGFIASARHTATGPASAGGWVGLPAAVLIGPEAGWTEAELDQALAAGYRRLSLGPWVLRTEVAVSAALASLTAAVDEPMPPGPKREPSAP